MNLLLLLLLSSRGYWNGTTAEYQSFHGDCHANGPGIWAIGVVVHCGCNRYAERDPIEEWDVKVMEKDKQIKKLAAKKGVWHCVEIEPTTPNVRNPFALPICVDGSGCGDPIGPPPFLEPRAEKEARTK